MESYRNIETIHDSLPPPHWRFSGLERQNNGSSGGVFLGVGEVDVGGAQEKGNGYLAPVQLSDPARNPGLAHIPG